MPQGGGLSYLVGEKIRLKHPPALLPAVIRDCKGRLRFQRAVSSDWSSATTGRAALATHFTLGIGDYGARLPGVRAQEVEARPGNEVPTVMQKAPLLVAGLFAF